VFTGWYAGELDVGIVIERMTRRAVS